MAYPDIFVIIFIGVVATLLTDLWNLLLKHGFNIQSLNFCFLGRWILYMPNGKPSLGLGMASSKTPNPTQSRIKSIITHIIFGVGLWLSAFAIKYSQLER